MTFLTREDILGLSDISVKEITIPKDIHAWGGNTIRIKQLTRGEQDTFLKRQFGDTKMKQDGKAKNQEISSVNIYGHDAWLCVKGICTDQGVPMFTAADIPALENKSGEAVGWIALQIREFSNMEQDAKVARGEITSEEALAEEVKN